jgi:hypothetical protein
MALMLAPALAAVATVVSAAGQISVTGEADYLTGKYGGTLATDVTYVPVIVKYDDWPLSLKLTLPYIRITGPGNVIGADRITFAQNNNVVTRSTAEGLGDVIASGTYNLHYDDAAKFGYSVSGIVKFGTADAAKGLGTGKNDYALQADAYKTYANGILVFGGAGYKLLGSPDGNPLSDIWYASLGAGYNFTQATSAGLVFNFRQSPSLGGEAAREYTAYLSHQITPKTKMLGYVIKGNSDGSPDWGGGMQLTYSF